MRSVLLFLFCLVLFPVTARAGIPDKGYTKTLEDFASVVCVDGDAYHYNKLIVRSLSYTNKRALRAFTQIENLTEPELIDALRELVMAEVSFQNLLLLEQFTRLDGATLPLAWQFLAALKELDYSKGRVMTPFEQINVLSAPEVFAYIDRVKKMEHPAAWAFKAYLLLAGHDPQTIPAGFELLTRMNEQQQWAAEQSCRMDKMNAYNALELFKLFPKLSKTDAWNARGIFKQKIDPATAYWWVKYYFDEEKEQKEWLFFARSSEEKGLFLKGLAESSDFQTWKINDLHSVTDQLGREISSATLRAGSDSYLLKLFHRLDWKVQEKYKNSFEAALKKGKKSTAIVVLRSATGKARVQAALDITTMHNYILLSKGSELYDSSFRDILVPILDERIAERFNGNLLRFLLAVDPQNKHVSDFIISLAQRGKLAVFFPEDEEEQKQVLDLVTASAFQDENSLILFSATFMKLLETIEPKTRTYLIGEMLSAIRQEDTVFSLQLRVILQYYLQYYDEFVGEVDKIRIQMMMYEYGAVPLQLYSKTAFKEWKSDGKLSSLSVFHYDDDGRQSYFSNCGYLQKKGYRPRVSPFYELGTTPAVLAEAKRLAGSYSKHPSTSLKGLFRLQQKNPFVVDWVKRVKGIEISHSVFIFQGDHTQQELLKQFIKGKHEMFAQRGHSYWRSEQIIKPLAELVEKGDVSSDDLAGKQRFMSLGSCGGIRAYSEIAKLFNHNVDILATVGTGKAVVNNPYNQFLFEAVAAATNELSWDDVAEKSARIFKQGLGEDYLQPGSLPAILHKIMDQGSVEK